MVTPDILGVGILRLHLGGIGRRGTYCRSRLAPDYPVTVRSKSIPTR